MVHSPIQPHWSWPLHRQQYPLQADTGEEISEQKLDSLKVYIVENIVHRVIQFPENNVHTCTHTSFRHRVVVRFLIRILFV